MDKKAMDVKGIVVVGMFVAVLGGLSVVQIPMPSGVPITLQTFGVALCGYVLGWKRAGVAVGVYVLIGAVGVPVFSGMRGGFGVLLGPTGGFLVGFLALGVLCGVGLRLKGVFWGMLFGGGGLLVCHLLGALQFAFLTGRSLGEALVLVSVPYLVKDMISVVGAYYAGKILHKSIKWENI